MSVVGDHPISGIIRRADKALGRLSLWAATAVLTGVAVCMAEAFVSALWFLLDGEVPGRVLVVGAISCVVVALPIILHAQRLIRTLESQKRSLMILSDQLSRAQIEAEAGIRAKTAFLANMSHELRTPLNSIIGFSDILHTEMFGTLGSERYREYASDILASGQHLLSIINDILEFARIEAGQVNVVDEMIDFEVP